MSIEDHQPKPRILHPAENPTQRDYAPYPKPSPVPACDILDFLCPVCSVKTPMFTTLAFQDPDTGEITGRPWANGVVAYGDENGAIYCSTACAMRANPSSPLPPRSVRVALNHPIMKPKRWYQCFTAAQWGEAALWALMICLITLALLLG